MLDVAGECMESPWTVKLFHVLLIISNIHIAHENPFKTYLTRFYLYINIFPTIYILNTLVYAKFHLLLNTMPNLCSLNFVAS